MIMKLRNLNGTNYLMIPKTIMDKFTIFRYVDLDVNTLQIKPVYDDLELLSQVQDFLNNDEYFVKEDNNQILVSNLISCFKDDKYYSDNEKFVIEVLVSNDYLITSGVGVQKGCYYLQGYTYSDKYKENKIKIRKSREVDKWT